MDDIYCDLTSNVTLVHTNITPVHQLDFADKLAQYNYWNSKEKREYKSRNFNDITQGSIQLEGNIKTMYNYNYGWIENYDTNGDLQRYYIWITNYRQMSKSVVVVNYEVDVFQTFLFDINVNQCLIEREHVDDDEIGHNLIPENFELCEYHYSNLQSVEEMQDDLVYVIAYLPKDSFSSGVFGEKISPLVYRMYDKNGIEGFNQFIKDLNDDGRIESISYIFCFPKSFLSDSTKSYINSNTGVGNSEGIRSVEKCYQANKSDYFEGYTPKNNKLYNEPFAFLRVENDEGSSIHLKHECFLGDKFKFNFEVQSVFDKCSVFQLVPCNYKIGGLNYTDSISNNGYGLCMWINDAYANWYAQHKNSLIQSQANITRSYLTQDTITDNNFNQAMRNKNYANQINDINMLATGANGATGILSSLLGGNIGGAVQKGIGTGVNLAQMYATNNVNQNSMQTNSENSRNNSRIANETSYQNASKMLMSQKKDMQVQPNTARGSTEACGLDVARKTNTFYIKQVSISGRDAKRIDDFWQMYGYEVDRVGLPLTTTREKWNYIKTVNSNITADIPQPYLDILNGLYNQGFTVWHDESYMFNYNQENKVKEGV